MGTAIKHPVRTCRVSGRYTYPIRTGEGQYTYRVGVGVHVVVPRYAVGL